eukprot:CAMPEP_0179009202 /NCGR_PEP_ID=MMETSP0795-20121207/16146_1 /TAXON_ID=88552 /ORGANISM="Amoebophrya sp., Strain Ameob2" /LENGTH=152 /DNA_ID=CAMNT_0020704383 /DNA_START=129 /DNA_END=587 /DNA_ORIENTATION=+
MTPARPCPLFVAPITIKPLTPRRVLAAASGARNIHFRNATKFKYIAFEPFMAQPLFRVPRFRNPGVSTWTLPKVVVSRKVISTTRGKPIVIRGGASSAGSPVSVVSPNSDEEHKMVNQFMTGVPTKGRREIGTKHAGSKSTSAASKSTTDSA